MGQVADTVARWWELFEAGRFDDLPSLVAPDAEITMPGGMTFRGPAELRGLLEAYKAAFPDVHHETVASVEAEDAVAVELRITMTHTGTFATPAGELPPTGNVVVLAACDVVRIDPDGRVRTWHTYFDNASLLAQLNA